MQNFLMKFLNQLSEMTKTSYLNNVSMFRHFHKIYNLQNKSISLISDGQLKWTCRREFMLEKGLETIKNVFEFKRRTESLMN